MDSARDKLSGAAPLERKTLGYALYYLRLNGGVLHPLRYLLAKVQKSGRLLSKFSLPVGKGQSRREILVSTKACAQLEFGRRPPIGVRCCRDRALGRGLSYELGRITVRTRVAEARFVVAYIPIWD
jgi:hypothetical protein